jgi:REP element-mobilizing transposase RayT
MKESKRSTDRKSELIPTYLNFYRRNLPHWLPAGQMFFITFRLANSLPAHVLQELKEECERERQNTRVQFSGIQQRDELYKLDKKYYGQFDAWLDRCVDENPRWLVDENVARIVADEIHAMDGERYRLIAYCIMSNHVHLTIDTAGYDIEPTHNGVMALYPLAETLKRLKGRTARYCNQALKRTGTFWHPESYDHVIRDQQEYERIVWYILSNPVKAGLVEKWEDWKFSYVRQDV